MSAHLLLTGTASIALIGYSFAKWAAKGEIFHPGFIYSLVNGGIFIVFAFGPYVYPYTQSLYYYMYFFLICIFVKAIEQGSKTGVQRYIKDLKLKNKFIFILYILLILLTFSTSMELFLQTKGSLEGAVEARMEEVALSKDMSKF